MASIALERALGDAETVGGVPLIVTTVEDDLALGLAKEVLSMGAPAVAVIGTTGGKVIVSSTHPDVNAVEIAHEAASAMGGGGGGNAELAQGGGPRTEDLGSAMEAGAEAVRGRLA